MSKRRVKKKRSNRMWKTHDKLATALGKKVPKGVKPFSSSHVDRLQRLHSEATEKNK